MALVNLEAKRRGIGFAGELKPDLQSEFVQDLEVVFNKVENFDQAIDFLVEFVVDSINSIINDYSVVEERQEHYFGSDFDNDKEIFRIILITKYGLDKTKIGKIDLSILIKILLKSLRQKLENIENFAFDDDNNQLNPNKPNNSLEVVNLTTLSDYEETKKQLIAEQILTLISDKIYRQLINDFNCEVQEAIRRKIFFFRAHEFFHFLNFIGLQFKPDDLEKMKEQIKLSLYETFSDYIQIDNEGFARDLELKDLLAFLKEVFDVDFVEEIKVGLVQEINNIFY